MTWVDAAEASLPVDSVVAVEASGTLVALARAGAGWHAVEAWCTHAECPLTDGWVEGSALRCPCHGSLFDLATGRERFVSASFGRGQCAGRIGKRNGLIELVAGGQGAGQRAVKSIPRSG